MNYFDYENRAEYNRQQIKNEINQIRQAQAARRSRVYRPGAFEHMMFNFANWMISTGRQLRQRYEVPTAKCAHIQPKRFAH